MLRGEYDKTKEIMIGTTQHETEIYVRAVWTKPVNNFDYSL